MDGRSVPIMDILLILAFQLQMVVSDEMCRFNLTQPQGEITSIDLDQDGQYEDNMYCTWKIMLDEDSKIRLDVGMMDIEYGTQCQYDFLSFIDGKNSLGTFCGGYIPPPLVSSGNNILVVFWSDYNVSLTGFQLNYTSVPNTLCDVVETLLHGMISSPELDGNQDVYCVWTIISHTEFLKQVYITYLNIEYTEGCRKDYLKLYGDGDEDVQKLCDLDQPFLFNRITTAVFIEFDAVSMAGKGFRAVYSISDADGECGGILTNKTASILAPDRDNDGNYDNSLNCVWAITADEGHVIELEFQNLDLEETDNCDFDVIELLNGEDFGSYSAKVNRFCGNVVSNFYKNPTTFLSESNILLLQFISDNTVNGASFNVTYRWIDTDLLKTSTTEIDSTVKLINTTSSTITTTSIQTTKRSAAGKSLKPHLTLSPLLVLFFIIF